MSVGETVVVFVSIILGIALGDLLLSTHRLLRARERVDWHWLTPALAFFMLMNIIAFWWARAFSCSASTARSKAAS